MESVELQTPIAGDTVNAVGAVGGVWSIQKGPTCSVAAGADAFPAPSTVRTWNQCDTPSAAGGLVAEATSVSAVASGTVVESVSQTIEYPAMPLAATRGGRRGSGAGAAPCGGAAKRASPYRFRSTLT